MQEEKSTGRPAAVERRKDRSGLGESPTVVRMRNAPQRGGLLEMVRRSAVLQAGLLIVVGFAQRLPVCSIPEQVTVTAMRSDMIHHRCFGVSSLGCTHDAEGMRCKELLAGLLPCVTIATTRSASRILRMEGTVLLTVLPSGHKCRTTGMRAGMFRSYRHLCHLALSVCFQTLSDNPRYKRQLHSPDRSALLASGTHSREPEMERGKHSPFAPIP